MERKYYLNNKFYNSESERQVALRVSIPSSKNVITAENDPISLFSMANVSINTPASFSRSHDIKLGFFGWAIFSNIGILAFILIFVSFSRESAKLIYIGIGLLIAISTIVLLWQKKFWVFFGIAVALLANFGLWMIPFRSIILSIDPANVIMFMLIPFPLGFLVFMC